MNIYKVSRTDEALEEPGNEGYGAAVVAADSETAARQICGPWFDPDRIVSMDVEHIGTGRPELLAGIVLMQRFLNS